MRATEEDIEAFVAEQWPAFLTDAQRLISIDSSLDAEHAALGVPFGPGLRAALDEALAIAQRMGLEPHDGDGFPLGRVGISIRSALLARMACLLDAAPLTIRLRCSRRCMA